MSNPYSIQKQVTLQFPQPPKGERWHNPEALSPERVSEGFRLLTSGEVDILVKKSSAEVQGLKVQVCYNAKYPYWYWDGCDTVVRNFTYRVPDTTPIVTNRLKYNPDKFYGWLSACGVRKMMMLKAGEKFVLAKSPCDARSESMGLNTFEEWQSTAEVNESAIKEFNSLLDLATWMAGGK
jgi:hypothetical protein